MREAPDSVVAAVQEAHDAHYVIGWDAEAGMTCNCGATSPDGAWSKHAYETFADAAWAAAYPAALRDAAGRLMRDADISRVDLEVLLPSSPGRQCDCCHPTSDEAFSLVISRTRDRLRRWADESEA